MIRRTRPSPTTCAPNRSPINCAPPTFPRRRSLRSPTAAWVIAHPSAAAIYLGDTTAPVRSAADAGADAGSDGYDLNFENAPVTTVAKVILGDILGVGYIIDPRVQGTITLASGRAVSKADVLFVLENALRMSNVAMVRDRSGYRLIPAADATGNGFVDSDEATRAGYGISVVPLRYVSAQAM